MEEEILIGLSRVFLFIMGEECTVLAGTCGLLTTRTRFQTDYKTGYVLKLLINKYK